MKGCFGCFKVVSLIVTTVLFIAISIIVLFPMGGIKYLQEAKLPDFLKFGNKLPEVKDIRERAQRVGDFSAIPGNYELVRVIDMPGASAVIAKEINTEQKLALVNPGWFMDLSKNDLNQSTLETRIKSFAASINNPSVKMNLLQVGKNGEFTAFNQTVPYVRINFDLAGSGNEGKMQGIIGVAKDLANKNRIVLSVNKAGKYNQALTELYFKNIKFK